MSSRRSIFQALFRAFFLTLSLAPLTAGAATLEGVLLERGTRSPVADASVFVLPQKLKAVTDSDGRFKVEGVPEGEKFQWVVNLPGYLRLEKEDLLQDGDRGERRLFVEKSDYAVYETTVFGRGEKRDDSQRSVTAAQILSLPGTGNDPIKAVQNLPGVNRSSSFSSQIIIQGSAPEDTRYQIDNHQVPLIFHFGGLTSVLPPEVLDRVDYLSAGYGAENGRAIAGLVTTQTRSPKKDRFHGLAYFDVYNGALIAEGPVGKKSSYLFGIRQSYVGAILKSIFKDNPNFDLTVVPTFGDVTALYETELSPIDHFRLLAVGSSDQLEFLFERPVDMDAALRGSFKNSTRFFRLIPQWTRKINERTTGRFSLGIGKDFINVDIGNSFFYLNSYALTARGELEHKVSPLWTTQVGYDNRYAGARVDLRLRQVFVSGGVANPFSSGELRQVSTEGKFSDIGMYWRNQLKLSAESPWTFLPSLRSEYYRSTGQIFALPRLAARHQWSDSLQLRGALGMYVQPPREQDTDSTTGNPDIRAPRAYHLALSAEKDFREGSSRGLIWTPGVFYRYLDELVVPSTAVVTRNGVPTPENVNNSGFGRAYGFETQLRYDFAPWSGWVSYTLSRSTRANNGGPETTFQFDQTHLLTALIGVDLPRNWRLGSRLRVVTGNPVTPVTGAVFDADNDVYVPIRGATFSERLNSFVQLDFRVDKKWIYDSWILSAYLDIQNLTNRQNIEQLQYAYDYSSRTSVAGLPIIPSFGIRAEF